jgi:predicted nuclease of predicted toxin-antitoxin system
MNIVADESVDRAIVERLRSDGHDVQYIAELHPGIADNFVLDQANERKALLLTADKDFGDLVYHQRRIHTGVVLLRLAGLSKERKAAIVSEVLRQRETELAGGFSVVSPGAVRIRRDALDGQSDNGKA